MLITDTFFADITVNLTVAAALLGLIAALSHSLLSAVDHPADATLSTWTRGLLAQVELLHLAALSVVVCALAARMTYWMELICAPGDGPMIYRIEPSRLPIENAAELIFTVALVASHVWLLANPGLVRRRVRSGNGLVSRERPGPKQSAMQVTLRVARPIAWLGLAVVVVFGAVHSLAALLAMILSVVGWALITCLILQYAERDGPAETAPSRAQTR